MSPTHLPQSIDRYLALSHLPRDSVADHALPGPNSAACISLDTVTLPPFRNFVGVNAAPHSHMQAVQIEPRCRGNFRRGLPDDITGD